MTCRYPGCTIQISYWNKTGYCGHHWVDVKQELERAQRAKCKHPRCENTVSAKSKSGYCRVHAHTERGK